MNYYEWNTWNGKIIIARNSVEECLNSLKKENYLLWQQIQSGFLSNSFQKQYHEYVSENLESEKLTNAINSYRNEVINDKKNGKTCINFHENASNYELLEKNYWKLSNPLFEEFIEKNIINEKTPWCVEPVIYNINEILYFSTFE